MEFNSKILEVIQRTYDVKSFRLTHHPAFNFKPGQYILVTLIINGEEKKNYFSISSSPTQKNFLEFTQKLTGTKFSNKLDNLKKDDSITISGPSGSFTFEGEYPKVAMLAGGVGITPCRSMIAYCVENKIDSNIVVLYSNRTSEDILFKKEFDQLNSQNPNIKIVYTLTRAKEQWGGYSRRVDEEMIRTEIEDFMNRIFFLCGPSAFVSSMEKVLDNLNVNKDFVRKENF